MATLVLIVAILGLAATSRYPYWPSLLKLAKTALLSRLPLSAKKEQAKYVAAQILATPLRGAAAIIDEICYRGYKAVKINPIFIIGEPRCGSTFLHRTMAMSGHHLSIRHFEWRYPFVIVQKLIKFTGFDRVFARISYWPETADGAEAAKMHPDRLSDWEEDGIFFEEGFCHHFFIFLRFPYKTVMRNATCFSSLPNAVKKVFIEEHKKTIQKVARAHGFKEISYLSKEVVSHEMVPHLMSEYPNSRFIVTVRKSEDFVSSLLALARASTMAKNAGYDPTSDPSWQELILERIRRDCKILVSLCEHEIPESRQFRIVATNLFDDPKGTIESIYEWLGMDINENYYAYLSNIASNQSMRKRDYTYNIRRFADFALYDSFVDRLNKTKKSGMGQPLA